MTVYPADESRVLPGVSVFMTVRNEELHVTAALESLFAQDYEGDVQVVVAVGPSTDKTRELLLNLASQRDDLEVIDNPSGHTPDGLNLAISHCDFEILVRMDGHSVLPATYISTVVETLERTAAANVGGRMLPVGRSAFQRAVAYAMSNPVGIGRSRFHNGGVEGPAKTVYLGAFRRAPLNAVGGYDPCFLRAQDWELNYRLRSAGYIVWFTPKLAVTYYPRARWSSLAQQFYRTGQWRRAVANKYPASVSLRYLAPPAFLVILTASSLGSVVAGATGRPVLAAAAAAPIFTYFATLVEQSLHLAKTDSAAALRLPVVIATMHLYWGAGYLRGVAPRDSTI